MNKKIFFLLPTLAAGGAERVTITIARILHKNGHDVEFINLGRAEGEMKSWIEPEFKMVSFGCKRVLAALPKLFWFMIHTPNSMYFSSLEHVSVVGILSAMLSKRPIVVRVPNMPRNKLVKGFLGVKTRVIKILNQWLLSRAKRIIAQNAEMRNQLLDYYKLPEDKVIAIYNPVDKDFVLASAAGTKSPYQDGEIHFLSVCNVAYSKGIDVLEAAWPKVKSIIPNAHIYIVGRHHSDYAQPLVEKAKNLDSFTFLGFKENPYPYLKHCDCFVLPSRMEGFPNVLLEAMCFNRPIATTTCVEVIKEIIQDGKNGYCCDIEDPDALAKCMIGAVQLHDINNQYNLFNQEKLLEIFKE